MGIKVLWLIVFGSVGLSCCTCSGVRKQPRSSENETRGIAGDFFATGNEPSWSLLLKDNTFAFKSLSDRGEIAGMLPAVQHSGDSIVWYEAQAVDAAVRIEIARRECADNMSGKISQVSVRVTVKRASESTGTTFTGCGAYRGDFRLHDIWVLKSINGRSVPRQSGNPPVMEPHIATGQVMGNTTCNYFYGHFTANDGRVVIAGLTLAGKHASSNCNHPLEQEFVETLAQATRYDVQNGTLNFYAGNRLICNFFKVD